MSLKIGYSRQIGETIFEYVQTPDWCEDKSAWFTVTSSEDIEKENVFVAVLEESGQIAVLIPSAIGFSSYRMCSSWEQVAADLQPAFDQWNSTHKGFKHQLKAFADLTAP